jgi:hypothetical protein
MGGVGSGNWYRFDKKTTTEECRSLDVRRFRRKDLLKSGHWFSWCWWRAEVKVASIGVFVCQDRLVLAYRHRSGPGGEWEDVKEPVPLTWTACNFGGERPWWTCVGSVDCFKLRTVRGKESSATNEPDLPTGVSPRSYPAGKSLR